MTLREWMRREKMSQVGLQKWLDERGITITPQYLSDLVNGHRTAGTKFREVFRTLTGITLEPGFVEVENDHA